MMKRLKRKKKYFKKECRRCGEMFRPTGITETLCKECWIKAMRKPKKKTKLQEEKNER